MIGSALAGRLFKAARQSFTSGGCIAPKNSLHVTRSGSTGAGNIDSDVAFRGRSWVVFSGW